MIIFRVSTKKPFVDNCENGGAMWSFKNNLKKTTWVYSVYKLSLGSVTWDQQSSRHLSRVLCAISNDLSDEASLDLLPQVLFQVNQNFVQRLRVNHFRYRQTIFPTLQKKKCSRKWTSHFFRFRHVVSWGARRSKILSVSRKLLDRILIYFHLQL